MSYMLEKCQRCGKDLSAELVRLAGGYPAALCLEHLREWEQYIQVLPEYQALGVANSRHAAAVRAGDHDMAAILWRELDVTTRAAYAISKAWAEADPTPEREQNDQ